MRALQRYSITALWVARLACWSAATIGAKATCQRKGIVARLSHIVPLALGIVLLSVREPVPRLAARFLPRSEG
jgi:hypothetical protein